MDHPPESQSIPSMESRFVRQQLRRAVNDVVRLGATFVLLAYFFGARRWGAEFFAPAIAAAFFLPALMALLFVFRRIGRLMNQVGPDGHGFEPIQVVSADEDKTPPR